MKHILLSFLLFSLSCGVRASTIFSDDLAGTSLNATNWTTSLPFDTSMIIKTDGEVTTVGRGILSPNVHLDTSYTISGSFAMWDRYEHFNIALRSDLGSTGSPFADPTGLIVSFINDGNGICLQQYTNPMSAWTQVADAPFDLQTGETYDFSITDDGTNISVSIDGVDVLDGSSSYSTGDQIALYSREFPYTSTSIGPITIMGGNSKGTGQFGVESVGNDLTEPPGVPGESRPAPDISTTLLLIIGGLVPVWFMRFTQHRGISR